MERKIELFDTKSTVDTRKNNSIFQSTNNKLNTKECKIGLKYFQGSLITNVKIDFRDPSTNFNKSFMKSCQFFEKIMPKSCFLLGKIMNIFPKSFSGPNNICVKNNNVTDSN